ncbi:MAG: SDR family NAD(P)-dependent oxidoreductase [Bacteroidales bacterium]|nr:SDR family NAD(P)-dependent oxidoreductase [Bacteroidales bacterium]
MVKESNDKRWDERSIPDLTGRNIIVTGANSGIGFEAAKAMAGRGATIVMACRNIEKSADAFDKVRQESHNDKVELMRLDLADLSSVREFAGEAREKFPLIDILVNNAGIMVPPYGRTIDGFELQIGTNHLGHFLLTGLLMENIVAAPGSRVVTVTSIAHFGGRINFEDINSETGYRRMGAYRQSKLANLLFSYELDRRLKEKEKETISVAVHPGVTSTSIFKMPSWLERVKEAILMSSAKGALPTLMGATEPSLKGGEYIGPAGFRQSMGYPAILSSSNRSHDRQLALRLWELSEEMTSFRFSI